MSLVGGSTLGLLAKNVQAWKRLCVLSVTKLKKVLLHRHEDFYWTGTRQGIHILNLLACKSMSRWNKLVCFPLSRIDRMVQHFLVEAWINVTYFTLVGSLLKTIRLQCLDVVTNTLAYCNGVLFTMVKCFIVVTPRIAILMAWKVWQKYAAASRCCKYFFLNQE